MDPATALTGHAVPYLNLPWRLRQASAAIGSRSWSLASYIVLKRRDVRAICHDFHHHARTVFQLNLIYAVAIPNWKLKIPDSILSIHPQTPCGVRY